MAFLSGSLKHFAKMLIRSEYRSYHQSLEELNRAPRHTTCTTRILGPELNLTDAASFMHMYEEIFEKQIYLFEAHTNTPLIIDGGANIGAGTIYFKKLYPQARVIAFEPDKEIFSVLAKNIANFKLDNVELVNKALWNCETQLKFMAEGGDSGRVVGTNDEYKNV